MGRIGFALCTDFDAALAGMLEVCRLPGLEVTGLFQHFAVADDDSADSVAYTSQQHELFVRPVRALPRPVLSLPSSTATTPPG